MSTINFVREEQKYYIEEIKYNLLIERIGGYLEKDKYFQEKICSLYFDNSDDELVLKSLNKPIYKEKIRLRSYNVPNYNDKVFLEIKKKYKGVVYKRRIIIRYKEALEYINSNKKIDDSQIFKEINYCFIKYNLKPKMNIVYDRDSYYLKEDRSFRITFDYNVKASKDLFIFDELKNEKNFTKGYYIMELKSTKGMPIWLLKTLNELKIYPTNFSKYGKIYQKMKESELNV